MMMHIATHNMLKINTKQRNTINLHLFFLPDIYMPVAGQSAFIDKQFVRLQSIIEKEIDYQEELLEVLGMMDALFATMARKKSIGKENDSL